MVVFPLYGYHLGFVWNGSSFTVHTQERSQARGIEQWLVQLTDNQLETGLLVWHLATTYSYKFIFEKMKGMAVPVAARMYQHT